MKNIIKISKEILNIYRLLEKKDLSDQDKKTLLKKIEALSYKENQLFLELNISFDKYEYLFDEIYECDDDLVMIRLRHYLNYLFAKNKIFLPELIYYEDDIKDLRYFKFFYMEKELEKLIIKNSNDIREKYDILFMDKLLELEYFQNNFNFVSDNSYKPTNKKELKLFSDTKKMYIKDQLKYFMKNDNIEDTFYIIKSLLEFGNDNYEEYYNMIIEYLKNLEDKTKLNTYINYFGNRNKLK